MANNILTEKMHHYKYIVKDCMLNIPGDKPIKLEAFQIQELMIERDYETDYFPVFRLKLNLTPPVYHKLVENKAKSTIHVRLQKKPVEKSRTHALPAKDVFNKVFAIYMDENNPFYYGKEYKKTHGGNKIEGKITQPRDLDLSVDLYLFPEKEMNASKKIINIVFPSINMTDALTYTLGTGGFDRVLMTPLDNSGSYSQVVLPALSTLDTIEYLEEVFGFYNDGSLIFFDLDRSYVLSSNSKCTAWEPSEYKETVLISKAMNNETVMLTGSLDYGKEKKYIVNLRPYDVSVKNFSIQDAHITGSDIMAIDSRNDNISNAASTGEKRGANTVKVIANKYGNKFTASAMKRRRSAMNTVISVSISDFDIDAFKPNKTFKFIFEEGSSNSKVGGSYQLIKNVSLFKKTDGNDFEIMSVITFKK